MSWSPAMRESRRNRVRQLDWLDDPVLSYKLVCNGTDPLTNCFVVTRKEHACDICRETIAKGVRCRRETRRSDDGRKVITRHVCPTCCTAIEKWDEDGGRAINERHDAGDARAKGGAQ